MAKDKQVNGSDGDLFDSEWAIMQVVWAKQPCTAPDVRDELDASRGWAYTTVKTLMDRMVKKGLLEVEKVRNLHLYSAGISRSEARRSEVMKTVKRAFNGMLTPMMQFLIEDEGMTAEEFAELEQMVKKCKSAKVKKCKGKK